MGWGWGHETNQFSKLLLSDFIFLFFYFYFLFYFIFFEIGRTLQAVWKLSQLSTNFHSTVFKQTVELNACIIKFMNAFQVSGP